MLSTRKIKMKKRLAVVKGAGQIERLEWRVYLVVLAFLMFVCTWLTLLVISASTLSLFLLMWEPSTSVCSLFKIISELASVGFFRLIHCSSMAGRVGEEGARGTGDGAGTGTGNNVGNDRYFIRIITHGGRVRTPDRFYWTFKSYGSFFLSLFFLTCSFLSMDSVGSFS